MFKTLINKLMMVIYFIVGALILEFLTFYLLKLGLMPQYFWYNLSVILVVAFLVFIIPNYTAQFAVYTIILIAQAFLAYVNYSLITVYGDLLSIEMAQLLVEADKAMTSSFIYTEIIIAFVLVVGVVITIGALMLKHCVKDKGTIKQHYSVFCIILVLTSQLISWGFYLNFRNRTNATTHISDIKYTKSDSFLMNTSLLKSSSYQKFGTYGYFSNLIVNAIRNDGSSVERITLKYFNDGEIYGSLNNKSDVFGIDESNNVIVIMMESVEWFGLGDGKYDPTFRNLIYDDPQIGGGTLTPNITKLIYGEDYLSATQQESLMVKNFFAKSKTNMSEGQGIIGNYPIAQSLADVVEDDTAGRQALGYSMPNVLKRRGYNTAYVHSNDIEFYSRSETHSYLGFDKVIGKNNIKDDNGNNVYSKEDLKFHNWDAEGSFMQNAIDYVVPQDQSKPFYTFYLNVSSHGDYTEECNKNDGDAIKYFDYVRYGADDCVMVDGNWKLNKKESEATKTLWYQNVCDNHAEVSEMMVYYQCGIVGLDDAIGVIMDKLKERGIEDETTILLYSDHRAYYDNFSSIVKGIEVEDHNNKELNIIPMIISSPGLKNYNRNAENRFYENDRFCSSYDIVPTLFDLLGVRFNENLYPGNSLFKAIDSVYTENGKTKDMTVYYSNTGGVFGDGMYTFDMQTFVTNKNCSAETVDLFAAKSSELLIKINYIVLLNKYNWYYKITKI